MGERSLEELRVSEMERECRRADEKGVTVRFFGSEVLKLIAIARAARAYRDFGFLSQKEHDHAMRRLLTALAALDWEDAPLQRP